LKRGLIGGMDMQMIPSEHSMMVQFSGDTRKSSHVLEGGRVCVTLPLKVYLHVTSIPCTSCSVTIRTMLAAKALLKRCVSLDITAR